MAEISGKDLVDFAEKFTNYCWPNIGFDRNKVTPEYVLFCLKLANAATAGTAGIKFFELIWSGTILGSAPEMNDLIGMIIQSVPVVTTLRSIKNGTLRINQVQINDTIKIFINAGPTRGDVLGFFKYDDSCPTYP